jgi:hypothetical protein
MLHLLHLLLTPQEESCTIYLHGGVAQVVRAGVS